MLAISALPGQVIISCNYDPTAKEWVDLFDNPVLGWLVDETQLNPNLGQPVPPIGEAPVIVGTMPAGAVDTTPIFSPQWAHVVSNRIYVPDIWRGEIADFITWIATNNGAKRKVRGNFSDHNLSNIMYEWSKRNPELFRDEPF